MCDALTEKAVRADEDVDLDLQDVFSQTARSDDGSNKLREKFDTEESSLKGKLAINFRRQKYQRHI